MLCNHSIKMEKILTQILVLFLQTITNMFLIFYYIFLQESISTSTSTSFTGMFHIHISMIKHFLVNPCRVLIAIVQMHACYLTIRLMCSLAINI